MNMHKNARLTPKGRELLIERLERGEHPADVACAMGVSVRTVYKWRLRYREEGLSGLQDRSSRPLSSPARTAEAIETQVIACAGRSVSMILLQTKPASPAPPSAASWYAMVSTAGAIWSRPSR